MIIALTVWGQRISPVFDSSHMLLVAEIKNENVVGKRYETFEPGIPVFLKKRLDELSVSVLICGAISEGFAKIIESSGVKLFPFITGNADNVLNMFAEGKLDSGEFLMPGCGKRRGRKCKSKWK